MQKQKQFKLKLITNDVKQTRFYFHDLQMEDITDNKIIELFDKIKEETKSKDSPHYIEKENSDSKHHLQVMIKEDNDENTYFFGKLVQTHKTVNFGEEKYGELIDIDLDEESGIYYKQRGLIYFILFINKKKSERFLMVEDVPFTLNIGGIVNYLRERLSEKDINTKQKLGKDLVALLNAIKGSKMTLARLRLKKNIDTEDIKKIGIVEPALKELVNANLDAEIVLRWNKGKGKTFSDFFKSLFKIDTISEINSIDFGSILRTLYFETDSETGPKINMKDNIIRFSPPEIKDYYIEHEEELFNLMKEDFEDKYKNEKLND